MIDRKGITSFLAITFGITYAIKGALILAGFRVTQIPPLYGQYVIVAMMWVPALAAVLTIKWGTREGFSITNFRIGSWKPYLVSALLIPACFILIYALTWLLGLGLGQPGWHLTALRALMASSGANISTMPSPAVVLPALFLSSLFVGPLVNSIFAFDKEFGWCGYLLPKLMPLGKF